MTPCFIIGCMANRLLADGGLPRKLYCFSAVRLFRVRLQNSKYMSGLLGIPFSTLLHVDYFRGCQIDSGVPVTVPQ